MEHLQRYTRRHIGRFIPVIHPRGGIPGVNTTVIHTQGGYQEGIPQGTQGGIPGRYTRVYIGKQGGIPGRYTRVYRLQGASLTIIPGYIGSREPL